MMNISNEMLILALCISNVCCLIASFIKSERFKSSTTSAVSFLIHEQKDWTRKELAHQQHYLKGILDKTTITAKVSKSIGERAFNLASSANLAVMSVQRTLQVRPAYISRKKQIENEVAQENVMEAVGGTDDYSGFDWLYPCLSDEERELIDNARDHSTKYKEQLESSKEQ